MVRKPHFRRGITARSGGNVLLFAGCLIGAVFLLLEYRVYAPQREAAALPVSAVVNMSSGSATSGGRGSIRIPELALAAPITDGIGSIELIRGVGHIPGTAVAGGLGTMGLAGHRDTFFRALRGIRPGMGIFVTGPDGTYQYDVESIKIVDPSRVDVLSIAKEPKLVLVTCYPFTYVGAAPQRFIVSARLISLEPMPAGSPKVVPRVDSKRHP